MPGRFVVKKSASGKFMFNLQAGNYETILSSQQYAAKSSAENGIESVRNNCGNDDRFERKEAKNGQHYFVLKAGNGQIIGQSEMYKTKASMENGIASVVKNAPEGAVVDKSEE